MTTPGHDTDRDGPPDQAPSRRTARFLCDAMLGSLCRWLRFFGFDAEFGGVRASDAEIRRRAETDGRWLLTRDRELAAVGPRTVLVRGIGLEDQLVEVFSRLDLRPRADLDSSRCAMCNGVLEDAEREQVAGVVPAYTLRTAARFRRCRSCGRVFWPGTHGERIISRLERVVARVNRDDGPAGGRGHV